MKTVLIVDDDPFNAKGIALFLAGEGYTAVIAANAADAWNQAVNFPPDIAVIDIVIPEMEAGRRNVRESVGIRLALRLRALYPQLPVILFSAYEDRGLEVAEMIRRNMRGFAYKLKGCAAAELRRVMRQVEAGQLVIDPEVTDISRLGEVALTAVTEEERPWVENAVRQIPSLTPRERQIAERIAAAHKRSHIARSLKLNPKTVENHVTRIYNKLGLWEMSRQRPHLQQNVIVAKAFLIYDLSAK